tara:strand:- start:1981 stop:2916 length:936 start_codon:yes stop_codon:yes gene_type:complete
MSEATGGPSDETPGFWWIGAETGPVLVENAEAVMPYLPYYLAGWPIKWAGDTAPRTPDVRIIEHPDGTFQVLSAGPGGADFSFDNPYDAANGLAGALISVYVGRTPQTICLHAGAALVGGGLVIVIGDSFAGKSSVALHLAVLGHRFFGDDQIAVTLDNPSQGVCLGLMPKVRLPLPADCGDAFREFVDGYTSMQGDEMTYLKLWEGEAGTFGETAPVRALIFLDRDDSGNGAGAGENAGTSQLLPASRPELVKAMVRTAYAPHMSSPDLLAGLTRLADAADSYHLRFASSRDAAALLSREFRNLAAATLP